MVLDQTQEKLKEARYFIKKMVQTQKRPDEFRYNLDAFINSARSITWVLQKQNAKNPKFIGWYEKKRQEMQGDELLRFMVKARNVSVKEEVLNPDSLTHIRHIYIEQVPKGWSFVITRRGEPVWVKYPNTQNEIRIHANEYDEEVTIYYFFDKPKSPKTFFNTNIERFDVIRLCKLYLGYLEDIVKEAHTIIESASN
jgi:hypothetical protein